MSYYFLSLKFSTLAPNMSSLSQATQNKIAIIAGRKNIDRVSKHKKSFTVVMLLSNRKLTRLRKRAIVK